jgi:hypothetical protein
MFTQKPGRSQVLSCFFSQSASLQKAYKGKIYSSADDAISDIPNGSKLLVGGFGTYIDIQNHTILER